MRGLIGVSPLLALIGAASGGCLHAPVGFAVPERFTALGTEPFWAAKIDGKRLTYSTPLDQHGRTIEVVRKSGSNFANIDGTLDGQRLSLRVTAGPCSDGMSDTVYPFTVERTVGTVLEHGCARPD